MYLAFVTYKLQAVSCLPGMRCRFRARMEQLERLKGLLTKSQGQNLAVALCSVPCSLDKTGSRRLQETGDKRLDMPGWKGDLITPNYIAWCMGRRGVPRARNLLSFTLSRLSLSPLSLSPQPKETEMPVYLRTSISRFSRNEIDYTNAPLWPNRLVIFVAQEQSVDTIARK